MGSAASAASSKKTSGSAKRSSCTASDEEKKPGDLGEGYCTTKQAGGVATVIIKVGQEEYMNYDGDKAMTYGTLGHSGTAHPLYKGHVVLMRDHQEEVPGVAVLHPSVNINISLQRDLTHLQDFCNLNSNSPVCVISLREEPVLYAHSYSCHLYDINTHSMYRPPESFTKINSQSLTNSQLCHQRELQIRKELSNIATMTDDFRFFYYNTDDSSDDEPVPFSVIADDDLMTLGELSTVINFSPDEHVFVRHPMPIDSLPNMAVLDKFILTASKYLNKSFLLMDASVSTPRCQFGACILAIMCGLWSDVRLEPNLKLDDLSLRAVDYITSNIPEGGSRRLQVDNILLAICKDNMVTQLKQRIARMQENTKKGEGETLTPSDQYLIQLYCLLILVNAYWHDNQKESHSFSNWLILHSHLMDNFRAIGTSVKLNISDSLGRTTCLVADEDDYTDNLASFSDCKCNNMREIPGMPIYGSTSPSYEGAKGLVSYLIKKKKFAKVVLISLREDPVVFCNGQVYSLRYSNKKDSHIFLPHISANDLKKLEFQLAATAKKWELNKICHGKNLPATGSIQTTDELFNSIKDLSFRHFPIDMDKMPSTVMFTKIQDLVTDELLEQESDARTALVFYCESGKYRTTTAMAIAGIYYCSYEGYPYGADKGEVERTSIWDAMYTKGEFKIIQELVSLVPNGHQIKREVDFVLDQCFEMSSMMHYHTREETFVLYKRKQKLEKSNDDKKIEIPAIYLRSLDLLERYAGLIMYNSYLKTTWNPIAMALEARPSFSQWLSEVIFSWLGYSHAFVSTYDFS